MTTAPSIARWRRLTTPFKRRPSASTLLHRVANLLSAFPDAHNQRTCFRCDNEEEGFDSVVRQMMREKIPAPCGTEACILGWIVALSGLSSRKWRDSTIDVASRLLKSRLTLSDCNVIFSSYWGNRGRISVPAFLRLLANPKVPARAKSDAIKFVVQSYQPFDPQMDSARFIRRILSSPTP